MDANSSPSENTSIVLEGTPRREITEEFILDVAALADRHELEISGVSVLED